VLIHVAVPVPNLDLLTYAVSDGTAAPVVGARVVVPLGTRIVTGIVVETNVASSEPRTSGAIQRRAFHIVRSVRRSWFSGW